MNSAEFIHLRSQGFNAPSEDVTREEFLRRAVASGMTPDRSAFHADITEAMGSRCLIGGVKVGIKKETP
jgi:hypothetical protein